jgi:cob(I)alamin adenosyltransferase
VLFVAFLKGRNRSGEFKVMQKINSPALKLVTYGRECPYPEQDCCPGQQECIILPDNVTGRDFTYIENGLNNARDEIIKGKWDLVVLDEIINVYNLFPQYQSPIINIIDERPPDMDLLITGSNCPLILKQKASLFTEMESVVHPFNYGIKAKRGIDY